MSKPAKWIGNIGTLLRKDNNITQIFVLTQYFI